ncbi:carbohydrate ABC transporter permease [Shimia sp. R9_1]|uniref:carbohydrate ABC transporter permease n=1 Tax=Shimia sp. R9_1 TaxID=2821111 RepID=UPI001ADCEBA9|nr:carbohydrate ABC transporter permease [Shimia sp. R9_1]MBO9409819.1 carbohydrate ABC transporter permease [Shimia sp. R9_1]
MAAAQKTPPLNARLGWFIVWLCLGLAFVFYATPILWLLLAAFRDEPTLFSSGPFSLGRFEMLAQTWHNLTTYNDFQIGRWALNSAIYTIGGVSLSLVAVLPAGFILATYDFALRKTILVLTLVAMITPNTVVALPIFLQMQAFGLNNSYLGMIIATAFFPFGVYLAYIYYATSLPNGLIDAARIDGASRFEVFSKVALPLSKPLIALVALFSFLANWSNYFLAFVLLTKDELYSLPIGLAVLVSSSGALGNDVASDIPINKPEAIVAAILVIAPVLLLFLASQKYVRAGTLSGAEKG